MTPLCLFVLVMSLALLQHRSHRELYLNVYFGLLLCALCALFTAISVNNNGLHGQLFHRQSSQSFLTHVSICSASCYIDLVIQTSKHKIYIPLHQPTILLKQKGETQLPGPTRKNDPSVHPMSHPSGLNGKQVQSNLRKRDGPTCLHWFVDSPAVLEMWLQLP